MSTENEGRDEQERCDRCATCGAGPEAPIRDCARPTRCALPKGHDGPCKERELIAARPPVPSGEEPKPERDTREGWYLDPQRWSNAQLAAWIDYPLLAGQTHPYDRWLAVLTAVRDRLRSAPASPPEQPSVVVAPMSEESRRLAEAALAGLDARRDEDPKEWAERLGADIAATPSDTAASPPSGEVERLVAVWETRARDNRDNPPYGSQTAASVYERCADDLRAALRSTSTSEVDHE